LRQIGGALAHSTHIGFKASQTLYYAQRQAKRIGFPLTHYAVINFSSTRISPTDAVTCFGKIRRDDFAKFATPRSKRGGPAFPPTYAYTFENERDGVAFMTMEPEDDHNVHVNWLLHLPAERIYGFEQQVWEWVEKRTGGITGGASTIFVGPISTETVSNYICKGALQTSLDRYGGEQKHKPQGVIVGRRSSTSRNLGPTARRALDRELGIRRSLPKRRPDHRPSV